MLALTISQPSILPPTTSTHNIHNLHDLHNPQNEDESNRASNPNSSAALRRLNPGNNPGPRGSRGNRDGGANPGPPPSAYMFLPLNGRQGFNQLEFSEKLSQLQHTAVRCTDHVQSAVAERCRELRAQGHSEIEAQLITNTEFDVS